MHVGVSLCSVVPLRLCLCPAAAGCCMHAMQPTDFFIQVLCGTLRRTCGTNKRIPHSRYIYAIRRVCVYKDDCICVFECLRIYCVSQRNKQVFHIWLICAYVTGYDLYVLPFNLNEEKLYPMKIPIQNLILFLILSILEICIKWKINTPNEY